MCDEPKELRGVVGLWGWWYVGHSHHASVAPLDRARSIGVGGVVNWGEQGGQLGLE